MVCLKDNSVHYLYAESRPCLKCNRVGFFICMIIDKLFKVTSFNCPFLCRFSGSDSVIIFSICIF